MLAQDIPSSAHQPDYKSLQRMGLGIDDKNKSAVDDIVEGLLPNEAKDPTIDTVKNLVKAFMSRKNEFGQTMLATKSLAMDGVREVIEKNPQLINASLVNSMTNIAMHDGEKGDFGGRLHADGRSGALRVLGEVVERRPDLTTATLVKTVTQSAASDPDSIAREEAQRTLGTIAQKRPDLIDADAVKTIAKTATSRISDEDAKRLAYEQRNNILQSGHGAFESDHGHWSALTADQKTGLTKIPPEGRLIGWQFPGSDKKASEIAQDTLKLIAEKRPDLIAANRADNPLQNSSFSGRGASASVVEKAAQAYNAETSKTATFKPKQSDTVLHTAPASPRPVITP